MGPSREALPKSVTWGLLGAWAVHDLEELLTMPAASRRIAARLKARHPQVPDRVWERLEVSPAHAGVAIAVMGGFMTVAAAAGARSGGRSGLYQAALAGFGWHSVTHLAQAAVLRTYTPGLVTAPLVVAPFSVWAWRRLVAADVPTDVRGSTPQVVLMLPLTIGTSHLAAHLLTRRSASRRRAQARGRSA